MRAKGYDIRIGPVASEEHTNEIINITKAQIKEIIIKITA